MLQGMTISMADPAGTSRLTVEDIKWPIGHLGLDEQRIKVLAHFKAANSVLHEFSTHACLECALVIARVCMCVCMCVRVWAHAASWPRPLLLAAG